MNLAPAIHGWLLLDDDGGARYRVVAWACSDDGIVSPVIVMTHGAVAVMPISSPSHHLTYDPRTYDRI